MPTSPRTEDTSTVEVPLGVPSPVASVPSNADVVFSSGDAATIKKLVIFFAVAYFAQGVGQHVGFVAQPLQFYLKSLGMSPVQMSQATAALIVPWSLKPLYGLITDLFPLWGLRRRPYLFVMTALAMVAYVAMALAPSLNLIIAALFAVSFGVAFGDVLVDAITIENGQRLGQVRKFQSVQWMWMSVAGILASLVGGQLAERFDPRTAITIAALLPLPFFGLMLWSAARAVKEEPVQLNREEVLRSARSLVSAVKDKTLLKTMVILGLFTIAPSVGTPFYVYLTDTLKISQAQIGISSAIGGVAVVIGALLFNRFLSTERYGYRRVLALVMVVNTLGTFALFAVKDATTLYVVDFTTGLLIIMAKLAIFGIVGEICPKRAEGFTFALVMGLINFATKGSDLLGSYLFERLGNQMGPLIWISALTTLATLVLLPFMPNASEQTNTINAPEPLPQH